MHLLITNTKEPAPSPPPRKIMWRRVRKWALPEDREVVPVGGETLPLNCFCTTTLSLLVMSLHHFRQECVK